MGLCLSALLRTFGTSRIVGLGDPMTFRAADLTAVDALKVFFFFFRAMKTP